MFIVIIFKGCPVVCLFRLNSLRNGKVGVLMYLCTHSLGRDKWGFQAPIYPPPILPPFLTWDIRCRHRLLSLNTGTGAFQGRGVSAERHGAWSSAKRGAHSRCCPFPGSMTEKGSKENFRGTSYYIFTFLKLCTVAFKGLYCTAP